MSEILSAESWWNHLAAVEKAQAGDPTTAHMNALGVHDSALRDRVRVLTEALAARTLMLDSDGMEYVVETDEPIDQLEREDFPIRIDADGTMRIASGRRIGRRYQSMRAPSRSNIESSPSYDETRAWRQVALELFQRVCELDDEVGPMHEAVHTVESIELTRRDDPSVRDRPGTTEMADASRRFG
jgi:hypothetical protein